MESNRCSPAHHPFRVIISGRDSGSGEVEVGKGRVGGEYTEAVGREVEGVVMRISEEGIEREEREKRGKSDLFVGASVLSAEA